MKNGLRNSDGWNCPIPTENQRRAPFTSAPMNGTAISSATHTAQPISARRLAVCTGSIETKNMTGRSEEHTSELQSLMRNSYAVFCLQKKKTKHNHTKNTTR